MNDFIFCVPCQTPALDHASHLIRQAGYTVTNRPSKDITHLLLPAPSFTPGGNLSGGGDLSEILSKLAHNTIIAGGNLNRDELKSYNTLDLLQNPYYVAQNANITAHCAIGIAMEQLPCTLYRCPVLVIGWGRIGKVLCKLLEGLGACINICARNPADRAMAQALGYRALDIPQIVLSQFRVVFNTVPALLFPSTPTGILKIDLASQPGLGGEDVISARGLPGKYAPESSGALIAETLLGTL